MTKPTIDYNISVGNIISWTMIVLGFVVGWVRLQEAVASNTKSVVDAREAAFQVKKDLDESVKAKDSAIFLITNDVTAIKVNIQYIKESVDEIKKDMKQSNR